MHRRSFIAAAGAVVLPGCASVLPELAASPDFVVTTLAQRTVESLPEGQLFWRVETFPTRADAQAAGGPMSLAAEVSGRVWLVTLGSRGGATAGATHVAEIGPVPRIAAKRYELRLNHAHAPPGAATSVHTHPGSEAFYVLSGRLSQFTVHGVGRVGAGNAMNGRTPGMVMQLQSTGRDDLDQLVLFLVDADKPFSAPATFR